MKLHWKPERDTSSGLISFCAELTKRFGSAGVGFADQALTGARQFTVLWFASILMSKEAFADFAVINSAALLITQLPSYVIRLPMLVLGGSTFSHDRNNYVSRVRWMDAGLSLLVGLVVGAYLLLRFQRISAVAIALFIAMCTFANILEVNRRASYMAGRPWIACRSSAAGLIVASAGLVLLHLWFPLDLTGALAIQVVSILVAIALCWRGPLFPAKDDLMTLKCLMLAHRPYAGWELLGGTLLWCSTNGLIVFFADLMTAGEIGAFRLLTSLSALITLPVGVTEMLLTTRASQLFYRQGRVGLAGWLRSTDAALGRFLIPYLFLTTIGCWIAVRLMFSSKYPEVIFMFPIFAIHMNLTILPATRNIALRAMTLQRLVCVSEIGRGAISLTLCIVAFALHSVVALTFAVPFGTLAFVLGQWRSTRRELFGI